jgi:predicted glycoside hydrolase/deacetylase ChbG (UPF0249 family)
MRNTAHADVHRAGERILIVNADDFGQSQGVNRGIIEAHERGIVTSASLMVRWPAAPAAADYARSRPQLGVGLHIDFGEWALRDGEWVSLYETVTLTNGDDVQREVERQLDRFIALMQQPPTHLDSHQHVHFEQPARSVVRKLARRLGIPVRRGSPGIAYRGDFYGQTNQGEAYLDGISVAVLIGLLRDLPPGVTELGCHPGYGDDLDSMYRDERAIEVKTLCDPAVQAVLAEHDIRLHSFASLRSKPE